MLVIGAGVAGISCALEAVALGSEVMLVTPGVLELGADENALSAKRAGLALAGGNTALAQGCLLYTSRCV